MSIYNLTLLGVVHTQTWSNVTGLVYFEEGKQTLDETENLVDIPLADLPEEMMRPSKETLDELLANFRS